MTITDQTTPETSSKERPRLNPVKKGIKFGFILALITVPTAGIFGWKDGETNERHSNTEALKEAKTLKKCQTFVVDQGARNQVPANKRAVVSFDSLSDAAKETCGLPKEIELDDGNKMWELKRDARAGFPKDVDVDHIETNVFVTLPSVNTLSSRIKDLTEEGKDKNALDIAFAAAGWMALAATGSGVAAALRFLQIDLRQIQ